MRFWRPYVPVAKRRANASRQVAKLAKKRGTPTSPIAIEGRKIVRTFWGQAWCDNLESYSDFANRLPRGRTYVRNGSVVDLSISTGEINALVAGSDVYKVKVDIAATSKKDWQAIKRTCAGSIDSLLDLLQGRFDQSVMASLARQQGGLFPKPSEIRFRCSCPDWAWMCKHVAAVLYGVGARLDEDPEMLFLLRDVDHLELVADAGDAGRLDESLGDGATTTLEGADLSEMFGIEFDGADSDTAGTTAGTTDRRQPAARRAKRSQSVKKQPGKKKAATIKTAKTKPAKRQTAKKRTAKKQTAKKQTAKKQTAKKRTAKKRTAKKRTAKKQTAKKQTAKKQAAKKRTAKKPSSKKQAAQKLAAQITAPKSSQPHRKAKKKASSATSRRTLSR